MLGNFAIAANTFAITAESLCYMPGYGIGDAATTLVGQSNGAGVTTSVGVSPIPRCFWHGGHGVYGTGDVSFAPEMIGVLSPVAEIRSLGTPALRIEALPEPMFAASIVTYGVCVGVGDTLKPALINLAACGWYAFRWRQVLCAYLRSLGVWFAMVVELTPAGALSFLFHLFRGKWMKNMK